MGKKILIGVAGLLAIGLLNRPPPNSAVQATTASSFNSAYSVAPRPTPPPTGLHINSNITPVADISHECNSFRESAQNAQDQADRARNPDLRRSWESNRDMAQNSYRAFCQ